MANTDGPHAPKGNTYRRDAAGPEGQARKHAATMATEKLRDEARIAADRAEKAAKVAVAAAKKTRPIYVGPGAGSGSSKGQGLVFSETRQNEYLEHRRTGRSVSAAAKLTGVTMTEVLRVRKLSPAFAEAEKMVDQERADVLLEEYIEFGRTTDPKLLEKALKWLDPERFGDQPKRVEKTVTRVNEVGPVLASIAELQARLAERKALSAGGQRDQSDDVIDVEWVEDEVVVRAPTPIEEDDGPE